MFSNMSLHITDTHMLSIINRIKDADYIGKGANGIVYKIHYRNKSAVIKLPVSNKTFRSIDNEIDIYDHLCKEFDKCYCHQHIVQMYAYNANHHAIILEYFDGLDLLSYLNYPISPITFYTHRLEERMKKDDFNNHLYELTGIHTKNQLIRYIFNQIMSGVLCLHSVSVQHNDLELKNILVNSEGKVAITDFGSRIIGYGLTHESYDGLLYVLGKDCNNIGPMMGNFIDSKNNTPFQLRLETNKDFKYAFSLPISVYLKDIFLVLMSFPEIAVFVSLMYYLHNIDDSHTLLQDGLDYYNNNIDNEEIPNEIKNKMYITNEDMEGLLNIPLKTTADGNHLDLLLTYSRLVITKIFTMFGFAMTSGPIYDQINTLFGSDNYDEAIRAIKQQFECGVLVKLIYLFEKVYVEE